MYYVYTIYYNVKVYIRYKYPPIYLLYIKCKHSCSKVNIQYNVI